MASGSFLKARGKLADLEVAAQDRLLDAEALFVAGRFASTIAMGLYALEIALKVQICRRLDRDDLPEPFAIHKLEELLVAAGLANKIRKVKRPRGVWANWQELVWLSRDIEKFRYTTNVDWNEALATKTLRELREPPCGVLLWLSKQK